MQSNFYIRPKDDELYHYGRKGMKWGQHIFGKVKAAGQRVGTKMKAASDRASEKRKVRRADKKERKRIETLMSKPLRKLSDDELKERTNRLNKEKLAFDLERQMKNVNPDQVKKGSSFAKKFLSEAVGNAAISAGKNALTDFFTKKAKSMLGLSDNEVSELKKRKEEFDVLDYKVKIRDAKYDLDDPDGAKKSQDKKYNLNQNQNQNNQNQNQNNQNSKKNKNKQNNSTNSTPVSEAKNTEAYKDGKDFMDELFKDWSYGDIDSKKKTN